MIHNQILETYYEDPKQFDKETRNLIKKSVKVDPNAIRWKDFNTVADRLNSSELVDYYLDNNLTYWKAVAQGAYRIFKSKKGQCTDAAYFAYEILKKAGYKTFMRSVRWGTNDWNDVHTGSGIIMNDGQFILVADFGWEGIHGNSLSGPYENITDVDRRLSRGRRITHRAWGAFYPPR